MQTFQNFLVILTNASEELGDKLRTSLSTHSEQPHMTIRKANVEILLQAQTNSSSLHRTSQPRVDQEPTHYTPTESYDSSTQPKQNLLLFSVLNFKLTHSLKTRTSISPRASSCLREISISIAPSSSRKRRHTPKSSKNFPCLPYDPANCRALAFLHSLVILPHPSSPSNPPPSSQFLPSYQLPHLLRHLPIQRRQVMLLHLHLPLQPNPESSVTQLRVTDIACFTV
jgi:hypothetical protein